MEPGISMKAFDRRNSSSRELSRLSNTFLILQNMWLLEAHSKQFIFGEPVINLYDLRQGVVSEDHKEI